MSTRNLRSSTRLASVALPRYYIKIVDLEIDGLQSGEFEVKKAFDITNCKGDKQQINGIIIQHIQKSARVTKKIDGTTMTTTEEIRNYTNGNVDFMNNSYLEIFKIINGRSFDADSFSNGAIVPYEGNEAMIVNPPYNDKDINYMTKGIIIQSGESIFIHNPDIIKQIKTDYNWNNSEDLPSNGLPYLDDIHKDAIFRFKESNTANHLCTITWDYKDNVSKVKSIIKYVNNMGGGNSKRNITLRLKLSRYKQRNIKLC